MKHLKLSVFATLALLMSACSSNENSNSEESTSAVVVMSLDAENSSLNWAGRENENHFRKGTVNFTEGSISLEGDKIISGSFTIDMNSISAQDEGLPAEKIKYLNGHLKDTAFFQTYDFPNTIVTIGEYKDGELETTISVLGVDLKNNIPVEVNTSGENVTIKGDFSIDLAETGMKYITDVNPETGVPSAKSIVEFKLNLNLKK